MDACKGGVGEERSRWLGYVILKARFRRDLFVERSKLFSAQHRSLRDVVRSPRGG